MDSFTVKFNQEIMGFCATPFDIVRQIMREAQSQVDRTIDALKGRGESHASILAKVQPHELHFEWSANVDVGYETLAIYRHGWSVPIVVLDRSFPWNGTDNHSRMAEFVKHHFQDKPEAFRRQAAEHSVDMLNRLIVKWMEVDLGEVRRHNPCISLTNAKIEDLIDVN